LRVLIPVLLALAMGGLILLVLGKDPLAYYGYVLKRGLLSWGGMQETLTRMAPLLLIAAGLIVAFRAGIWNLGGDGQFLLAAVVTAALGPALIDVLPRGLTLVICMIVSMLVGALWSVIPALLKARYGVNEIVTSLMMSFLGTSFANVLVKLFFRDPTTTVPQTRDLPVDDRLPRILDTTIHSGVLIAVAVVILVHLMMTRTSFGLKLQIVGANPAAAVHAGLNVGWLTIATFALSAGLIGLAGSVEILGVWGTVRADWNPSFGLLVVPIVFLARLNGYAVIGFTLFFSALMIGGESAARRIGVPQHYVLVLVALLLIFLALVEYLDHLRRKRLTA
jgi:simple sugar transport system permease protein